MVTAGAILGGVVLAAGASTLVIASFGTEAVKPAQHMLLEIGQPLPAVLECGIAVRTLFEDFGWIVGLVGLVLAAAAPILAWRTRRARSSIVVALVGILLFVSLDVGLALVPIGASFVLQALAKVVESEHERQGSGDVPELASRVATALEDALDHRKGVLELSSGKHGFILYEGPGVADRQPAGSLDYARCWRMDGCLLLPWVPPGERPVNEPHVLAPQARNADRSLAILEKSGVVDELPFELGKGSSGFATVYRRVFEAPATGGAAPLGYLLDARSAACPKAPESGGPSRGLWVIDPRDRPSSDLVRISVLFFRGFDAKAAEAGLVPDSNEPLTALELLVSP